MKVRLEIDDTLNEDEIKQLIESFKSKPKIQFFKQDTEYYLDLLTSLSSTISI